MTRGFIFCALTLLLFSKIAYPQVTYPENEDGPFEDMLTPQYYLAEPGDSFRVAINKLVYYAREVEFQHPLQQEDGSISAYNITRGFGDGIGGPAGAPQHHAAIDIHLENNEDHLPLYAVYDGYVSTYVDAPKYRHYLAISKDLYDSTNTPIGKLVTLYAHLDLDLDSSAGLNMDGQYVAQGDTVSMNLYSETVGGPHLHFEIRLYRSNDAGDETFYSFVGQEGSDVFTEPSAGSWSYGYWKPLVGYGFVDPENHIPTTTTRINERERISPNSSELFQNYPNPFNPNTSLRYTLPVRSDVIVAIYDVHGREVKNIVHESQSAGTYKVQWNGSDASGLLVSSGMYFARLQAGEFSRVVKMVYLR
ncbi:MAG: T9SS type A sorting domain-containing protein [Candidatus Marinimicrobia bacterium]|nr:T9SS type A sorting domain-containing protein [Candidatus Neomarinimicrobiota bacterium]